MASIDDVGIDVDFSFEDQVASNDACTKVKAEEEAQTVLPACTGTDSFRKQEPNEFSPSENTMQPADTSSESSFDFDAPVGGSNTVVVNDDDEEEFDFVVTKKETPEIRIENSEEKSVEKVTDCHPSEEKSPVPSAKTLQQDVAVANNSSQVNGEISDAGDERAELTESSPIQWKTAQKEWDDVKDVQLESDDEEDDGVASSNTPIISSQEAFNFLKNSDNVLALYRNQIVTTVQRSGFQAFIHVLFGPPRLKRHLIQERDVIFSTALHPYNSNDATHFRMLLSVYKSVTGNSLDCPKFGGHWDEIGFQGDDPGTDFRGTGMLGLLCLLNLSCHKVEVGEGGDVGRDERSRLRHQLCLSLHRLSRDPEQNFPLAIMSINWTRLLLQTLREGCLNKALNAACSAQGMQFSAAFLELHAAVAFKFLGVWQREHKTILDSGLVLRDLEDALRRNATGVLKDWSTHLAGRGPGAAAAAPQGRSEQNKKRADRYAVGSAGPDDAKDEGVAQLSMLK